MPTPSAPRSADFGDIELLVGAVAHGGHCVARFDGRVVFVRHALPGERVRARLTDADPGARFWRADAVRILEPSVDRVAAAWPQAGPGGVGGGELSHVALAAQRQWKATVVGEQLRSRAHLDVGVTVDPVPGDDARGGLGYRTRIDLVADAEGRAGMFRFRSHEVTALSTMPLATPEVLELAERAEVFTRRWPPGARIEVIQPHDAAPGLILVDGHVWHAGRWDKRPNARRSVTETVATKDGPVQFKVAATGFWQVHRGAPRALVHAVQDAVAGGVGDTVVDLYSGAGLFTKTLAALVGPSGRVVAVESDAQAVRDARRNLFDAPHVELHEGPVHRVLAQVTMPSVRAVVLDPPRAGAGHRAAARIVDLNPDRIVYVSCDPATLGRDIASFGALGYQVRTVQAMDVFPMTHHVECIAVLER